ncbi:hypothetical protein [Paraburkholderia sp. CI3]|uniref:hypothetical protein n=1 Tax=Paraburkholderia sp. CI3 TaxID=2991060 RepID=UPI003D1A1A62
MQDAQRQSQVRMTADEWRKTHRDFKTVIDGQRYILRWTEFGTSLVPVTIIKEQK